MAPASALAFLLLLSLLIVGERRCRETDGDGCDYCEIRSIFVCHINELL